MICGGPRNVEVDYADAQNGNQTWLLENPEL